MGSLKFARTERLREWIRGVTPEICPERAIIATRTYKETESEPMALRRAKTFYNTLAEMTVCIYDGELIVGNQCSKPRSSPIFPETTASWIKDDISDFWTRGSDKFYVRPEVEAVLKKDVFPYWEGKTVQDRTLDLIPEESKNAWLLDYRIYSNDLHWKNAVGHLVADYEIVLKKGYGKLADEIKEKIDSLDMTQAENVEKMVFYQSSLICAQAAIMFTKRFSKLAAALALEEEDEMRRAELKEISRICDKVPEKPAETFQEALQALWFHQLLIQLEVDGLAISTERFDSLMFPYYEHDVNAGVITKEYAQELLECLWIKFFEIMKAYDNVNAKYYSGYSIGQILTIGGQDDEGNDNTNELSFLCMEAEDNMRLTQPNLAIRYNVNTPDDFLLRVCEYIKVGTGKPSLFNDGAIIPALLSRGVKLNEARNYALIGCVEASPKGMYYGWTNSGMFNLAKCIELAMNDGVCMLSGEQVGPKTGKAKDFKSIDEFISAYKKQVEYFITQMIATLNGIDYAHQNNLPTPYLSICMKDCVEKGKDITKGGARYNFTAPQGVGLADCADSLSALFQLVFKEKKYPMAEVVDALKANFEGYEKLHRDLKNAPKFGNDDDRVDRFGVMVGKHFCAELEKYPNARGGRFHAGLYPVSSNVPMGLDVGALPSGRLSQVPLADGVSPAINGDKLGPTAVIKSVAKLDHMAASNGSLLNQKFNPKTLEGTEQMGKFMKLIRTYFDLGGWHIQFNVISAETMRKAQKSPEKYKNLLVRIAGYSAFFTELDADLQENLISRTEQQQF